MTLWEATDLSQNCKEMVNIRSMMLHLLGLAGMLYWCQHVFAQEPAAPRSDLVANQETFVSQTTRTLDEDKITDESKRSDDLVLTSVRRLLR